MSITIFRLPKDICLALRDTPQPPKWHAEGSVFNHVSLVLEYAKQHFPEDPELQLVALFHDLGKIDTTRAKEGRIVAYGHEDHAQKYIDALRGEFPEFPNEETWEKVSFICKNHMKMHRVFSGEMRPFKIQELQSSKFWESAVRFAECDDKGRG